MNNYKELVTAFGITHLGFVETLWKPLAKNFGIKAFGYRRFLPDGTSLGLHTHAGWHKAYCDHFLDQHIPLYAREIEKVSSGAESMFFRVGKPSFQHPFEQTLCDQGLWNSFALYLKNHDCIEGFYFSATIEEPSGLSFYINNLHILSLFATHFSQRVNGIMTSRASLDLYRPTVEENVYVKRSLRGNSKTLEDIIQSLQIEEFQLMVGKKSVIISLREFQCLFLMSKGQTFKEIGKNLDLSPRTIESYINNLKSKTGTNSKSELIKLYFNSPYKNLGV